MAEKRMSDEEYELTQMNLVMMAQLIEGLDLPAFIERAERALAIGPLVDPTLFRQAHGKLEQVLKLASAANGFRAEAVRQGLRVNSGD
jgi:hypothetical protein